MCVYVFMYVCVCVLSSLKKLSGSRIDPEMIDFGEQVAVCVLACVCVSMC